MGPPSPPSPANWHSIPAQHRGRPALGEKGKKAVTLKLEDVPLETAVRLLAEVADLPVRSSNVLFVTSIGQGQGAG